MPVDIPGMVDTLVSVGVKTMQHQQALHGLSRTYTIRGPTARAYNFLCGNEAPDAKREAARERLHGLPAPQPEGNPCRTGREKLDERDEEVPQHDLTALSLDDPTQWPMSWTTLPDLYSAGLPQLDEWVSTVDVAQPDKATEAFFPAIARGGRSYNLILARKGRTPAGYARDTRRDRRQPGTR